MNITNGRGSFPFNNIILKFKCNVIRSPLVLGSVNSIVCHQRSYYSHQHYDNELHFSVTDEKLRIFKSERETQIFLEKYSSDSYSSLSLLLGKDYLLPKAVLVQILSPDLKQTLSPPGIPTEKYAMMGEIILNMELAELLSSNKNNITAAIGTENGYDFDSLLADSARDLQEFNNLRKLAKESGINRQIRTESLARNNRKDQYGVRALRAVIGAVHMILGEKAAKHFVQVKIAQNLFRISRNKI
ncbi:hypothetical protein NADFUDRAFT_49238 [Nadsonia fulvescens var. elongata DSM 6958]|uniref:RNase III domain-containing protein n=1 Tax=Nadsonia fulvescens var. elongata DSM 6958 TaxID=857566 RepID=A0A1E3PTE2_9ASCO|nr:hypothetical protein NADFUDRAFT_49238 [Nadsonia fulvescens var. elongata DSM 6958]